jgi:hypothetical protein
LFDVVLLFFVLLLTFATPADTLPVLELLDMHNVKRSSMLVNFIVLVIVLVVVVVSLTISQLL